MLSVLPLVVSLACEAVAPLAAISTPGTASRGVVPDAEANAKQMVWDDEDKGVKTPTEIVALMERARSAAR